MQQSVREIKDIRWDRFFERVVERIVDVTVPHVMEEIADVANFRAPQIQEHGVEVFKVTNTSGCQERIGDEIVAVEQSIPPERWRGDQAHS